MHKFLVALSLIISTPLAAQQSDAGSKVALADNQEMTAIYLADQAARDHPATIDWKVLWPADKARRGQTQALLDAGRLGSANDFYHAAYVFQHGEDAEDCLKAHALAVVATARGKQEATWIAAATLDRYLQRIGKHKYTELSFCIRRAKSGRRSHIGEIFSQMPCVKHPGFHHLPRRKGSGRIGSGSFHEPNSSI